MILRHDLKDRSIFNKLKDASNTSLKNFPWKQIKNCRQRRSLQNCESHVCTGWPSFRFYREFSDFQFLSWLFRKVDEIDQLLLGRKKNGAEGTWTDDPPIDLGGKSSILASNGVDRHSCLHLKVPDLLLWVDAQPSHTSSSNQLEITT